MSNPTTKLYLHLAIAMGCTSVDEVLKTSQLATGSLTPAEKAEANKEISKFWEQYDKYCMNGAQSL